MPSGDAHFLRSRSAKIIFLVLALGVLLRIFLVGTFSIQADSMAPTLLTGDFVVAQRVFTVERGDVVIVPCAQNEAVSCVRRVIGLAGDRVEIRNQHLMWNGLPVDDAMATGGQTQESIKGRTWKIATTQVPDLAATVVPPGQVFLLNDRREDLTDSRTFGVVPIVQLEAKANWVWLSIDWAQNRVRWSRWLSAVR